jgi:hypothetical protein
MFYLIYVLFLFVWNNDLSVVIGATPWGAARPGVAVSWRDIGGGYRPDGQRDPTADSQGVGGPRAVGGDRGVGGVIVGVR